MSEVWCKCNGLGYFVTYQGSEVCKYCKGTGVLDLYTMTSEQAFYSKGLIGA